MGNRDATVSVAFRERGDMIVRQTPHIVGELAQYPTGLHGQAATCVMLTENMWRWLWFTLGGIPVWAGVIQGVVLEQATSLPLARTKVRVERIEGSQRLGMATVIAGATGSFVVHGLPTGQYVVTATRAAFVPELYRSKPGDSRTAVLNLKEDGEIFAEVRMRRMGAITGRIVDENRVGIPGVTVIAYEARVPLRSAAQAKTDDRGIYRIHGLTAGKYYVRTGPFQLEDGPGLLPTFYPFGVSIADVRPVAVSYDRETTDIEIQPSPGKLFQLSVKPLCESMATLVLAADTGRREVKTPCGVAYTFAELAPGDYELLAYVGEGERISKAWYEHRPFDRDTTQSVQPIPLPTVRVRIEPAGRTATVIGRRRDLAGAFDSVVFLEQTRSPVLPGTWELAARAADSSHCISEIWTGGQEVDPKSPEWAVAHTAYGDSAVEVKVGDQPAAVAGVVTSKGEVAPGAPVYLYPMTPATMQAMNGARQVFSGADGSYRFDGITPGRYLVASSFDVIEVTEEALKSANAQFLDLGPGTSATRQLTLWEPE